MTIFGFSLSTAAPRWKNAKQMEPKMGALRRKSGPVALFGPVLGLSLESAGRLPEDATKPQ